jgi:hypothetical protein
MWAWDKLALESHIRLATYNCGFNLLSLSLSVSSFNMRILRLSPCVCVCVCVCVFGVRIK